MRQKLPLSLFLLLMLSGCYKDPAYEELSSNFTVVTNRDPKADFVIFKTYYISDTVAYRTSVAKDTAMTGADAKALVDAVKSNLNARGYTLVAKNARPDLGINLGVIKDTDVGVIYPGWWYGYPGWYGGYYWGWNYPYYYPFGITYVISSGNVIVDMVDLKSAAPKQQLGIVWNAFIGGGLSTSTSINVQRAVDGIDQAFEQSPYLTTGK